MRQPIKAGRLDALDGLRGLAATGVVALHVWMFDWGGEGRPPKQPLDYFLGEMRLGVSLFFVLSGFLLYRPFIAAAFGGRRPSIGRYAFRRVARIVPAYWLVLVGTLTIVYAYGQPTFGDDLARLPAFVLFAQNQVFEARHFNPPLWTIGIEMSFYVTLPLIALAAVRIGPRMRAQVLLVLALVAAGIGFGLMAELHAWPTTVTKTLPVHLPEFGAGMLAALLVQRVSVGRRTGVACALAGVVLVVIDSVWHSQEIGSRLARDAIADAPAAAGFGLIVLGLVAAPGMGRWLASPPLRLLGTLSYGIYLWHYPMIRLLRAEKWWPMDLVPKFALVFGFCAVAATFSWFCVERPVMRWSARTIEKRRARATRSAARHPLPAPARA